MSEIIEIETVQAVEVIPEQPIVSAGSAKVYDVALNEPQQAAGTDYLLTLTVA
jgi:hypothetical protein